MRQTITGEVEDRPQEHGTEPGATRGTGCGTSRDMERNDHSLPVIASPLDAVGAVDAAPPCAARMTVTDWLRNRC